MNREGIIEAIVPADLFSFPRNYFDYSGAVIVRFVGHAVQLIWAGGGLDA